MFGDIKYLDINLHFIVCCCRALTICKTRGAQAVLGLVLLSCPDGHNVPFSLEGNWVSYPVVTPFSMPLEPLYAYVC